VLTGAVATTLAYFLLVPDVGALVGAEGEAPAFAAPAAHQWKAVALLFRDGLANLHPMCILAMKVGVVLGALLTVLEQVVPLRLRRFVPSTTGLGLGFILPFANPLAMFLGAVGAAVASRINKKLSSTYVPLVAAGGIAGESISGVLVSIYNALSK
jgi:uncharacterized oligopeptide transporter (OPT) family protein